VPGAVPKAPPVLECQQAVPSPSEYIFSCAARELLHGSRTYRLGVKMTAVTGSHAGEISPSMNTRPSAGSGATRFPAID